ncbi:MAG: hypothetical protein ACPGYV_02795 [Phycisphaeraceae bacterium]
MKIISTPSVFALLLMIGVLIAGSDAAVAQQSVGVPNEIAEMEAKLAEAGEASSSARKKLALRRIIREGEGLLDAATTESKRYQVLDVLFRTQQQLVTIDGSDANRAMLLGIAEQLAAAPNAYAALRLDADLLLSQVSLAKAGADLQSRGDALKPFVERYYDTDVESKVIKIAMLMALEYGDATLIQHLREVIAERIPGDLEMINFMRDNLGGQVFGAPFVGRFETSDGKTALYPMDALGKTTALYFWTKEGDGIEQLREIAKGWAAVTADADRNAPIRYQFVSFNLDGLPDAGESILREVGLDWPAMHLPGGPEHPIYKTYVRHTPKLLTMTPAGYTAMVMSGSTRVKPGGWERAFGSGLSRSWSREDYSVQMQSLLTGEFAVIDPVGAFDPANPPEWKAVHGESSDTTKRLNRSAASVPEATLHAIQACFVPPPARYRLFYQQLLDNFAKAETLCRQAIETHSAADDLWIVRNRRIVALMGLWKIEGKREHFDAAVREAAAAIEAGYPPGTDVLARFCIARDSLRAENAERRSIIADFVQGPDDGSLSATVYALASILALDIGDRPLHETYRRLSLDTYSNHPSAWTAHTLFLDRYHRHWLYHPPFTAGWTFGRRMSYFFSIGEDEDANRTVNTTLNTLDRKPFRIPEDLGGKYTLVEFVTEGQDTPWLRRHGAFLQDRPLDDINVLYVVLGQDAAELQQAHEAHNQKEISRNRKPDPATILTLPGGLDHPLVRQLGIVPPDEGKRQGSSVAFLRTDGSVAAFKSTMTGGKGNMAQNMVHRYDEHAVDQALADGDLEEAKRIAFAHAPIEQIKPEGAPRNWRPKKISHTHLRARAKVYMAMEQWQQAAEDIEAVYLEVFKTAGSLSMNTEELLETEKLRDAIAERLDSE